MPVSRSQILYWQTLTGRRRHASQVTAVPPSNNKSDTLYAQVKTRGGWGYGGAWQMQLFYFHGWPAKALSRIVIESLDPFTSQLTTTSDFDWSLVGVFVNGQPHLPPARQSR
jgi:hypothetical protein